MSRQANRELAAWMRASGLVPTGAAWKAAQSGERDLDALMRLNLADGVAAKRTADGARLPAGMRSGDLYAGGVIAGDPLIDPETGSVWVTVRRDGEDLSDVALDPRVPVEYERPRIAPAWVRDAAASYRDARDAWESARESDRVVPSTVPGTAGAACAMYQLDDATYREHVPPPRYADFLRDAADRNRCPA